jgi:hypothetical protein
VEVEMVGKIGRENVLNFGNWRRGKDWRFGVVRKDR